MPEPDNTTTQAEPAEGQGEDRHHYRADMRMHLRAVREGWSGAVNNELRQQAVKRTKEVLDDRNATPRDVARAVRTVVDIDRLCVDAVVHEDKAERLDTGSPTDITGVLTTEQIRAVAATYHLTTARLPALPAPATGTEGPAEGSAVPHQQEQ